MTENNWDRGQAHMRKMMGEPFAQGMTSAAESGAFGADVARMAIEFCFGDVWGRPGLDLKYRSLTVIAVLIAQRQTAELKNHVRFGIGNGLTPKEIEEAIIQSLPYVGFAAVSSALQATIEVLREMGLDTQSMTAHESGML
jgi:4-carboxymuconolactone decarboxylase